MGSRPGDAPKSGCLFASALRFLLPEPFIVEVLNHRRVHLAIKRDTRIFTVDPNKLAYRSMDSLDPQQNTLAHLRETSPTFDLAAALGHIDHFNIEWARTHPPLYQHLKRLAFG